MIKEISHNNLKFSLEFLVKSQVFQGNNLLNQYYSHRNCFSFLAMFIFVIGLICIQFPSQALAEQTKPTSSNPLQTPNSVAQAAMQWGAQKCAARIHQVTNFVGFNEKAGAMLIMPPTKVDKHLIPASLEIPTPSGPAYVSATFAPNQANGCGATYDAILYWEAGCKTVATKQFNSFKSIGTLKKSLLVLDGGISTKVFLMPAGSGCVSIKKEVVN